MALNKHWCAQGTIDSTRIIYRHILRRTRHIRNCTHIKLCSKHNLIYTSVLSWHSYTNVLSWHNGKLHTCALKAQHCTQNHRYLAGLLMIRPYLVRTGVAVDTEDCAGTGVDLCIGCVDENEVFPGDGGGDGGRPVTGVPGCPARYTPGCWSEDAVG